MQTRSTSVALVLILLTGLLLAVLTGCGAGDEATGPARAGPAFAFEIDPASEQIRRIADDALPATPLTRTADGARLLLPDVDLELVDYEAVFLPGNRTEIRASFRNASDCLFFTEPFTFEPNPATETIASSVEPEVPTVYEWHLAPGGIVPDVYSGTTTLLFEVTHQGEPFTYVVDAYAVVRDALGILNETATETLPDGSVLHGGNAWTLGSYWGRTYALVKTAPDGSVDTSFGRCGLASVDDSYFEGMVDLAAEADGTIWTIGNYGPRADLGRAIFSPDGALVDTWSGYCGDFNYHHSVEILPDGTIEIRGWSSCDTYKPSGGLWVKHFPGGMYGPWP